MPIVVIAMGIFYSLKLKAHHLFKFIIIEIEFIKCKKCIIKL